MVDRKRVPTRFPLALMLGMAAWLALGSRDLSAQEPDARYRVQVAALADAESARSEAQSVYRLLEGVHAAYVFDASPLHAVRLGDFASAPAARRVLFRVRALGYPDAWLAKVRPDEPVTVVPAGEVVIEPPAASRPSPAVEEEVATALVTEIEVATPGSKVADPVPKRLPSPRVSLRTRPGRVGRERISAPDRDLPVAFFVATPAPAAIATAGPSLMAKPEPAVVRTPALMVISRDEPVANASARAQREESVLEAGAARADPPRVRTLVEQVAGATVYLDVGIEVGLADGDTIEVARDSLGPALGSMLVVRSSRSRAVLSFSGDPFSITRGQVLYLTPLREVEAGADTRGRTGAETGRIADSNRVGASETRTAAAGRARTDGAQTEFRQSSGGGPTVRGRVSLDVDATRSTTRYGSGDAQEIDRTFATPALRFRTHVTDLPGDLSLTANTRVTYRYNNSGFQQTPTAVRLYELSLAKSFRNAPLELRAGRFYNPYESYSGYWDGLLARVGTRTVGIGVVAGFQPDRWNQGFSTDLPKFSLFADARLRSDRLRYDVDVSAHRVQPNNGFLRHTFVGLSQRLRVGAFRLNQDLQVDEDPIEGGWEITRLRFDAGVDVNDRLQLRAGISRHRPYRLWDSLTVISYPRDQASAGVTIRVAGGSVGADVAVNRDLDDRIGRSFSSFFRLPERGPLGLGFNGAARYWTGAGYSVLSLSPGLSRSFGSTRTQLSYRFYRSRYDDREFLTHTVEGGFSLFVGRGLRYSLRASTQWSADLFSNRVYTGLSKNF